MLEFGHNKRTFTEINNQETYATEQEKNNRLVHFLKHKQEKSFIVTTYFLSALSFLHYPTPESGTQKLRESQVMQQNLGGA